MSDDYRIDGAAVHGISDLYTQLNALLMADESWTLGPSLDALNDVLYRFHDSPATFVWMQHAHSRDSLGVEETRRWLQAKLDQPGKYDQPHIRRQLDDLLAGTGPTYFELVLEIFADHPEIQLELR